MYYFHIAYDVQVKSSLNVEEYQSKSGRLDATTTLHSSGNSTIFKSTYPTGTEKDPTIVLTAICPFILIKGFLLYEYGAVCYASRGKHRSVAF